jgi:hypothetical protein
MLVFVTLADATSFLMVNLVPAPSAVKTTATKK